MFARKRHRIPFVIFPTEFAEEDDNVAKAIIAHEFAHVYLEHCGGTPQEVEKQEQDADRLVGEWGLDFDALAKWREAASQ